ncbi:DUF4124 domain-containing protein [Azoarcus sp. L1K30]|uniref:DUF4124 domain-containing protein n=1 Tax=Azoarcus sp. L1K30 TaxID=2820277 RepID=UPI001B8235D1|nr:DUF4124 domain-containing protein [Azoarcus sp. L1K30]MBR0567839.1 DUF4124 domain-containing protein [Azoarcus sp. L1K30]
MSAMRKLPLYLVLLTAPLAHAQVFKCVDDSGRTTYTNDRNLARGCKALDSDQTVSSIPAPRPSTSQATPSSFPRVTPNAQRERDDARRQVLEKELETEESALADARKALTEQEAIRLGDERNYQKVLDRLQPFKDKVELHQRNVDALRKEISGLR